MAIRNATRWAGGQLLTAQDLNVNVSGAIDDLAGRNGTIELENSLLIESGDDGNHYLQLPVGTTAQRPSNPPFGCLRFNTTINNAEYWNGRSWRPLSQGLAQVMTYSAFNGNGAVGKGANQVAEGNHIHAFAAPRNISIRRSREYDSRRDRYRSLTIHATWDAVPASEGVSPTLYEVVFAPSFFPDSPTTRTTSGLASMRSGYNSTAFAAGSVRVRVLRPYPGPQASAIWNSSTPTTTTRR